VGILTSHSQSTLWWISSGSSLSLVSGLVATVYVGSSAAMAGASAKRAVSNVPSCSAHMADRNLDLFLRLFHQSARLGLPEAMESPSRANPRTTRRRLSAWSTAASSSLCHPRSLPLRCRFLLWRQQQRQHRRHLHPPAIRYMKQLLSDVMLRMISRRRLPH
jgi:hypothetical protein